MNKSHQYFERLVLVCIDSYDSEKRRILQHFSAFLQDLHSFAPLISQIFSKKILNIFTIFPKKNHEIYKSLSLFGNILMNVAQNFTKRSEIFCENRKNVDLQHMF